MKRLLAVLLILTMVLPMCVFANAAETKAEIKPFVITNSEDLGTDFDNFYGKVQFWSRASDEYIYDDGMKVSVPGVGSTPKTIAKNLKPIFDEYPEGTRYLRFTALRAAMVYHTDDTIFFEKGIQIVHDWFEEFINEYKAIGGKLDGVVADVEIFDGFAYYLNQTALTKMYVYKDIVENPNYATKIRPALEERGFKFYENVTAETPEIYSISSNAGSAYSDCAAIWNVVIRNHYNQYVNDAFLDTLLGSYPDAVLCDYQARDTYAWHKIQGESGGVSAGGNYYTAGNVNYLNTYASRPGSGFFTDNGKAIYKNIQGYNDVAWADNAFNMVMWDSIFAKQLKESSPDGRFTATISHYIYNSRPGSYCRSPYYSEMTYHLGMLDPDPFQSYCIDSEITSRGGDIDTVIKVISENLDELTRVAGYADREHIPLAYSWNDKYILTGMYAGGRNIWRITPDTIGTNTTLESFKVAGTKDPTFTINGQTVTFPGGKIIEDSVISQVGSCGYWVETPKDVLPVRTYDANRYEQYPAYMESYESYEANADFDLSQAFPAGCWEVKKDKGSTAKVVTDGTGKALAMTGTYSLKLNTVLKNITAGDTYAENQAWEVEVNVPTDMAADAEIIALNIYGNKAKAEEGGFKIAGGKVYYDNNGTYVELTGVDVSAGGKFKLKRCVDFNNAEALTSDYAVYDASGNLLGQVKDIPMVKVEIPVQKLNISVSGITGTAVKFDNLKLYANGVAADFELYNAKTGIEYDDLDTAKNSNTAYRLSWMNATQYEKVYSIVAEYSDGTTKVIKEIKMAPGTDGVDTGVVAVAEGQTVKVYARNDSQPEPEDDGTIQPGADAANPNGQSKKKGDIGMLIAIIAVAVVLVGIVVAAVIFLTKKPAPKKEEAAKKVEETQEDQQ